MCYDNANIVSGHIPGAQTSINILMYHIHCNAHKVGFNHGNYFIRKI